MKKTFKIISFLLSFAFIFTLLPLASLAETYEGECGEGLTWSLNTETGLLTISGTGDMTEYENEEQLPWYDYSLLVKAIVIEEGVTSAYKWAFSACVNAESLSVPSTLKTYECYMVECTSLKTVTFVDGVEGILGSFMYCTALETVVLPDTLIGIGVNAFSGCTALENVNLPESIRYILNNAFEGCTSLESITFPSGIVEIGQCAFADCTSLKTVIFEGVDSLGVDDGSDRDVPFSNIFAGCPSLEYNVYGNAKYLGNDETPYLLLISAISDDITSVEIHEDAKCIAGTAFQSCNNLKAVVIPENIVGMGQSVFTECKNLTDIFCVAESIPSDWESAWSHSMDGNVFDVHWGFAVSENGDVNADGSIDIFDYILVKGYHFGSDDITAEELFRADINQDGMVDVFDYLGIKVICFN